MNDELGAEPNDEPENDELGAEEAECTWLGGAPYDGFGAEAVCTWLGGAPYEGLGAGTENDGLEAEAVCTWLGGTIATVGVNDAC